MPKWLIWIVRIGYTIIGAVSIGTGVLMIRVVNARPLITSKIVQESGTHQALTFWWGCGALFMVGVWMITHAIINYNFKEAQQ